MTSQPIGVVLAGGAGRRIGGDKALVALDGRPLLEHALDAVAMVCPTLAVVAKRSTRLPRLVGRAAVWLEPDRPQHPRVGLVHALGCAAGAPVLVCAVDLPLVDEATLRALLSAAARDPGALAVVAASGDGRPQPLLGLYHAQARRPLRDAPPDGRLTDAVLALGDVHLVPVADPDVLLNVNRPEDLLRASAVRARRGAGAAVPPGGPRLTERG